MDADGYIQIVDRKKDMILVSGFNVYPNEVEAVLAEHPGVGDVAVVGVPDDECGEIVVAFVDEEGSGADRRGGASAREAVAHGLQGAAYRVFRDDLPKSNVGKVLRKDLREATAAAR